MLGPHIVFVEGMTPHAGLIHGLAMNGIALGDIRGRLGVGRNARSGEGKHWANGDADLPHNEARAARSFFLHAWRQERFKPVPYRSAPVTAGARARRRS